MSADLTRVQTLVTALLNANTRATDGTPSFTTAVGDKSRSQAEIAETCLEAALVTARYACESDSSPFRTAFISNVAVTHGSPIPFHYGDSSVPIITPYAGASFTLKGVRKAYDRIEAYRRNDNNIYSDIAHDASDSGLASDLAGFYDIVNGIFYFTGYSATMPIATFTRSDVFSKLDEGIEPVIVKVALSMSKKDGDSSDGIFASWTQEAQNDLDRMKAGASAFQPIDEALTARGDVT